MRAVRDNIQTYNEDQGTTLTLEDIVYAHGPKWTRLKTIPLYAPTDYENNTIEYMAAYVAAHICMHQEGKAHIFLVCF